MNPLRILAWNRQGLVAVVRRFGTLRDGGPFENFLLSLSLSEGERVSRQEVFEVSDVEHLTTWQMKVCFIDPKDVTRKQKPQTIGFSAVSTERAELEHFAESALARRPIAVPGGDEVHNVAVLEAIVKSAKEKSWAVVE